MEIKRSKKPVIPLSEIMAERIFILPAQMANSFDTTIGRPCVMVQVNGKKYYMPVEEPTPIPYAAFCILKDNGVKDFYESYEQGRPL